MDVTIDPDSEAAREGMRRALSIVTARLEAGPEDSALWSTILTHTLTEMWNSPRAVEEIANVIAALSTLAMAGFGAAAVETETESAEVLRSVALAWERGDLTL